jgi:hypothetical protein
MTANLIQGFTKIHKKMQQKNSRIQELVQGWTWIANPFGIHSKIPWYPKLLFQRENALASF